MQNKISELYFKETYPIKNYATKNECVYLFYNELTKLSKIGITSNISQRYRSLETSGGVILKLYGLCEIEKNEHESAKYIESYLHKFFKEQRKEGEWFNLNFCQQIQIINLFLKISD